MPKRLIDVGSLGGRPPRLIMSEDLCNQNIRYATLSYCWGNANFRTTKENEGSHKQQLPLQLIPRTLQDALNLTRNLQIQFLWIDALCIVQDDYAEWMVEASRMQDIYLGSSITIAATDAADSSMGCFFPSPGKLDKDSLFLTTRAAEQGSGTIIRVQPGDIRTSADKSVLNTRGWVLQEMVRHIAPCTACAQDSTGNVHLNVGLRQVLYSIDRRSTKVQSLFYLTTIQLRRPKHSGNRSRVTRDDASPFRKAGFLPCLESCNTIKRLQKMFQSLACGNVLFTRTCCG
jgi:hypothetical protein